MRHIAIFNNSGEIQAALDNETLANPYVALVSGVVDYNSLSPTLPMGEWENFPDTNIFNIIEDDLSYWSADYIHIGTLHNVRLDENHSFGDAEVYIIYRSLDNYWEIMFDFGYGSYNANFQGSGTDYPPFELAGGNYHFYLRAEDVHGDGKLSQFFLAALDEHYQYAVEYSMDTINPPYPTE